MTEHQSKIPQIIDTEHIPLTADIEQMPPTADIIQIPVTQDIVHIPATEDILQMAAQMVDIQPLKRALGGNRYLEIKELNGSKRVDIRFWKDDTVPSKEGVSLHLDQWKALCNISDVIDDFLTKVIEKEPVEWRYHIGDDVFDTIKATYVCVHIRRHFVLKDEWTYHPTRRGVALHFGEWKELQKTIPLLAEREPELRQLVPLYRTCCIY
jgi:hypothetical protein